MKKNTIIILSAIGVASAIAFVIYKKKQANNVDEEDTATEEVNETAAYEQLEADEEIVEDMDVEEEGSDIATISYSKPDIDKYASTVLSSKYKDGPYIIEPTEFGAYEDYECISLTFYADGVLTDENDEKLSDEDIADTIGANFANSFGEYEDDSVHIRNDSRRCDYEILYDSRNYSDVAPQWEE